MSRALSATELGRALLDAASEPSGEELCQLLVDHASGLRRGFGVGVPELESLRASSDADRVRTIRSLLYDAKLRQREHRLARTVVQSVDAAAALARGARWAGGRVHLDVRVLLGPNLLADPTRKAIQFCVEDQAPINIMTVKLRRARRVLRSSDLECFIADECLRFRWKGAKGGLNLYSRELDRSEQATVLPVVLVRQRVDVPTCRPPIVEAVTRALSDVCLA